MDDFSHTIYLRIKYGSVKKPILSDDLVERKNANYLDNYELTSIGFRLR